MVPFRLIGAIQGITAPRLGARTVSKAFPIGQVERIARLAIPGDLVQILFRRYTQETQTCCIIYSLGRALLCVVGDVVDYGLL